MRGLAIGLLLLLSGCSGSSSTSAAGKPVTVAKVEQRDIPIYIDTIGNVYALSTIDITPQVSGEILVAHVKQGDYVEQNQLLYTIDPAPYQAKLDQTRAALLKDEASLALAKDKVKRYKPLLEEDFISQFTYEQYLTEVATLEAQVLEDKAMIEEAAINLNYCYIKAPISGRTSQYDIDPGNIVSTDQQQALTTIRQLIPIEIRFTVTQRDFGKVKMADQESPLKFTATLPENPDKPYTGQIFFFDNHINLDTGTILIKGQILNMEKELWPGEFVKVRLFTGTQKDALIVPEPAVQVGSKKKFVYVLDEESMIITMRDIEVGEKVDGGIWIKSGLKEGETVITDGQMNLKNGDKVFIKEKAENK